MKIANMLATVALPFVFSFSVLSASNSMNVNQATDASTDVGVAAWESYVGSDIEIHASISSAGGSWSSTATLTDPMVCINARSPRVAINNAGECVAVWVAFDPGLSIDRLFSSMYYLGSWTTPVPCSSATEYIYSNDFNLEISDSGEINLSWSSIMLPSYLAVRALNNATFGTWSPSITTLEQ